MDEFNDEKSDSKFVRADGVYSLDSLISSFVGDTNSLFVEKSLNNTSSSSFCKLITFSIRDLAYSSFSSDTCASFAS